MERKIVTIGGGTGVSTLLRGLKKYTNQLTAIVTVGDDGGSSGVLREDLGMLPPGDIRQCISALAETNSILGELLNYRFPEGSLKGHAFGNLCLAALCGISDDFEEAVRKMNLAFGVVGSVLPVSNDDVRLKATLSDGQEVIGESKIGSVGHAPIKKLELIPKAPKPADGVLQAIYDADMIILGPGSLYTSILPNLLVEGVAEAIRESLAVKVYVGNIMTQPGETQGYTLYDHIRAIKEHAGAGLIDYVVANIQEIPEPIEAIYRADGAERVRVDVASFAEDRIRVILKNLASFEKNRYIRHDNAALAEVLMKL